MTKIYAFFLTLVAASAFGQVKETVHLKVTGGANAGTYDASTDRGGCSVGLTTPGAWGNQLSSPKDKDPKHFNSLQMIIPTPKAMTNDFYLSVGFGPLLNRSAEYKVETRAGQKKSGSGVVGVIDRGATGQITFSATTADGVKLEGTVDCKSVTRAPSK
jgi:hypothetical protein